MQDPQYFPVSLTSQTLWNLQLLSQGFGYSLELYIIPRNSLKIILNK